MNHSKNIYCLEGMWNDYNLKDKSSVMPVLELLLKTNYCDYIYHDCATKPEFEFFITKWAQKSISNKYPILYLAFHGEKERIYLNRKDFVTLDEIAEMLYGKCYGKIFYFASCSTLNIDKRKIQSFLSKTNAIAAFGYTDDVHWMTATACELLIFEAMKHDALDVKGIKKICHKIFYDYGNLPKQVNLRMVINKKMRSPAIRKIVRINPEF